MRRRTLLGSATIGWLRTTDCDPLPGPCEIGPSEELFPEQPAKTATAAATPSAYPMRVIRMLVYSSSRNGRTHTPKDTRFNRKFVVARPKIDTPLPFDLRVVR